MRTSLRILVGLIVILGAASEVVIAQSAAGTYALVQIGTNTLPATIETEDNCREEVVAATLTLDTNGTWRMERHERDVCADKTDNEQEVDTGRYRLTGNTIEFLDDDGKTQQNEEGDDLDDLSSGTIEGSVLRVKLGRSEMIAQFRRQ